MALNGALSGYLERALAGRCIICDRRLPRIRIALYTAHISSWDIDRGTDSRDVEVSVCGDKCLDEYNRGRVTA